MTLPRLTKLRVTGFRSLADVTLVPGSVTVLIGPNGAGKSNVLSALDLIRQLAFGSLRLFVSLRGGASYLLRNGPGETDRIGIALEFEESGTAYTYDGQLGYGADESLVFLSEHVGVTRDGQLQRRPLPPGGHESALARPEHDPLRRLLRGLIVYHFADTSRRSPLRTRDAARMDGSALLPDASNLPAFLLALRQSAQPSAQAAWRRIEGTLQRLAPFVRSLEPVEDRSGRVSLEWRNERGQVFGPAHLSDGTLRALALITALAQPEDGMPFLSCIDEPELGLHPAAIEMLCGLISSVGTRRQVIVATQSPTLLDHFRPEDVVVAELVDGATQLRRLDPAALAGWLEEYSLSQLFDKNLLGGRP